MVPSVATVSIQVRDTGGIGRAGGVADVRGVVVAGVDGAGGVGHARGVVGDSGWLGRGVLSR